ncbi:Zdhhc3, partial [Symbiodinium sp. CCMP2456]
PAGVSRLPDPVQGLLHDSGLCAGDMSKKQIDLAQQKRVPDDNEGLSPQKAPRTGGTVAASVTAEELQAMLSQQTAQLLQAQDSAVTRAAARFEAVVDEKVGKTNERVSDLERKLGNMEAKLGQLLQGEGSVSSGRVENDDQARRQRTLIFGGWARETRRGDLLSELKTALSKLDVEGLLDAPPFTTGVRRSMALASFAERRGESYGHMRARMQQVIRAFAEAEVLGVQGRKLWCNWSKSRLERMHSSHASWVKKGIAGIDESKLPDLEVEWNQGNVWTSQTDLDTKAWVNIKALSEASRLNAGDMSFAVYGWNIGGADFCEVPKALRDCTDGGLEKGDLIVLQEFPRSKAGWSSVTISGFKVVTYRDKDMWRGIGVAFDATVWNVISRRSTGRGVWVHLRHLSSGQSIWVSSAHFSPGVTQGEYEGEVEEHFKHKPARSPTVIFQADLNSSFRWVREGERVEATGRDGKADILARYAVAAGLDFVPPSRAQWDTPTSRPRQEGRTGKQIDYLLCCGIRRGQSTIHVDSCYRTGSDHESLSAIFTLRMPRVIERSNTRPRVWTGFRGVITDMDQQIVEKMARECTKPRPGSGYRDPDEVKQAFKRAKVSKTGEAWKKALNMRKGARKVWEADRLKRASEGDWQARRSCRPKRNAGWDDAFAEAQQGDPHEMVHKHLEGVYAGEQPDKELYKHRGEVSCFSVEEMRDAMTLLKAHKAVGCDLTSRELLVGIMEAPGGEQHMLEWFNRVLVRQEVPQQWNEPLLVMLPKVAMPTRCKQLRPIAMGSAVGKLFARMLLTRTASALSPRTASQCAAPHRQTADFLFSVHRIFELTREWGSQLCMVKVDLNKAFDCVDRSVLLRRLSEQMGSCAEMGCWAALMTDVAGTLQTPWGMSKLDMPSGIKQGAVESPSMFGFVAELALEDAKVRCRWDARDKLFQGMGEEECLFMDDGCLWSKGVHAMQQKLAEYSTHLRAFGLTINMSKCQMYCGPRCKGPHRLRLDGQDLSASPALEVMGLQFRVGGTTMEIATALATRARNRFWEIQHVLRAKGGLSRRISTMQRTAGQAALWCLSAIAPDAGAMGCLSCFSYVAAVTACLSGSLDPSHSCLLQRTVNAADASHHVPHDSPQDHQAGRKHDPANLVGYAIREDFEQVNDLLRERVQPARSSEAQDPPNGCLLQRALDARDALRHVPHDSPQDHQGGRKHDPANLAGCATRENDEQVSDLVRQRVLFQRRQRCQSCLVYVPTDTDGPHIQETSEQGISFFQGSVVLRQGQREITWEDLMEEFWGWFEQGLAVHEAVGMAVPCIQNRDHEGYQTWAIQELLRFSQGIPGCDGRPSAETSPRLFALWARHVDGLLWQIFAQEEQTTLTSTSLATREVGRPADPNPEDGHMAWLRRVRQQYLRLRANGFGKEARQALRERLRPCGDSVQVSAGQTLPDILGRSDDDLDPHYEGDLTDVESWVADVMTGWQERAARDPEPPRESPPRLPPRRHQAASSSEELPFGIFHAAHVWPDGSWSTAGDMTAMGFEGYDYAEPRASTDTRPRSRSPRRDGNDGEAEADSQSLMGLWMVMIPLCRTVDVLPDADNGPLWYRHIHAEGILLVRRGADPVEVGRRLLAQLQAVEDDRFAREAFRWINGVIQAAHEEGELQWRRDARAVPGDRELDRWCRETVSLVRFQWFRRTCPVAMLNRELERDLANEGYPDTRCPRHNYNDEARERRGLSWSRSRTPQRHFPEPPARSDDSDESGLMEHGRRVHRGRGDSWDREGDDSRDDGRDDRDRINPRWLKRPSDSTAERRPKAKARPQPKVCVTEEVRRLQPLPRRPPRERGSGSTDPAPAAGATPTAAETARLQEDHAVDAWRFLLGMDTQSFEEGIDVIPAGRALLPEYSSEMITESIANYNMHDRAILTTAFLRFLRLLMVEVMQAFERGVAAGEARRRSEVLVDVEVEHEAHPDEDGDGSSFVQTTAPGRFSAGRHDPRDSWFARLRGLQEALGGQSPAERNANAEALLARLHRTQEVQEQQREDLVAVLVAMQEETCQEVAGGDIQWQLAWWGSLFGSPEGAARGSGNQTGIRRPCPERDMTDADIQDMAAEEANARDEREQLLRRQALEQEDQEMRDQAYLQHQQNLLTGDSGVQRHLSAQEFRAWEDWEWAKIMEKPPQDRKRRSLVISVGGTMGDGGPWLSKQLRLPCGSGDRLPSLRLDMHLETEECPEDVETYIVPGQPQPAGEQGTGVTPCTDLERMPTTPGSDGEPPVVLAGETGARESTQLDVDTDTGGDGGGLQKLEFADYECLYEQWKCGAITNEAVVLKGGNDLLDLMEAQHIVDAEDMQSTQVLLQGASPSPTTSTTSSATLVMDEGVGLLIDIESFDEWVQQDVSLDDTTSPEVESEGE